MNSVSNILRFLNPKADEDVQRNADRRITRNLHYIALIVLIVEAVTDVIYLIRQVGRSVVPESLYFTQGSTLFCILMCLAAVLLSSRLLKQDKLSHPQCVLFRIVFFTLALVWSGYVDYHHYISGEHMLVVYTVLLVMVCFASFSPWMGMLVIGVGHAVFYMLLYSVDKARSVITFNYIVLMLVSMGANAVQYHNHLKVAANEIEQEKRNRILEIASLHDALTGLLNRLALEREAERADGSPLSVYMIDINYFKHLNDKYGHAEGDTVLQVTGANLRMLFPGANIYRYGGDEFLVVSRSPEEENYGEETYSFVHGVQRINVVLSIGSAHGSPAGYDDLFALITEADRSLYRVKDKTHADSGKE